MLTHQFVDTPYSHYTQAEANDFATFHHLHLAQVGVLAPEAVPTGKLCTGQVGYVITGMKTTKSAQIGDTWHLAKQAVKTLPGFKPAKSMVFSGRKLAHLLTLRLA